MVNSGGSRKKLVTDLHGVYWTGYDLPTRLRSLSLEGVNFAHAERGGVNLLYFLQNCPILRSLHLDLHDGWWEKCGSRFERGVVEWIESRPRITHFYVKQLSQDRHLQIQELLRERRERLSKPRWSLRIANFWQSSDGSFGFSNWWANIFQETGAKLCTRDFCTETPIGFDVMSGCMDIGGSIVICYISLQTGWDRPSTHVGGPWHFSSRRSKILAASACTFCSQEYGIHVKFHWIYPWFTHDLSITIYNMSSFM